METNYVIRVEGTAYRFGLGEVVAEGCAFFKAGRYNLTKDELKRAILATTVTEEPKQNRPSGRTQKHGFNRNRSGLQGKKR